MGAPPIVTGDRSPAVVAGSVDRWSWTELVPALSSANKLINTPDVYGGQLLIECRGSALNVEVRRETPRARHNLALQLGPGEQQVVDLIGAITVNATNPTGTDAEIALVILARWQIRSIPPVSSATEVTAAASPSPGPWVQATAGAGGESGFYPQQRPVLQLQATGRVQAEFRDLAGVSRATFELTPTGAANDLGGLATLIHPPQYTLFLRHPGDVNGTRSIITTWYREQR